MGLSKLLFSARYVNGVGHRIGRRLSSEVGHSPCSGAGVKEPSTVTAGAGAINNHAAVVGVFLDENNNYHLSSWGNTLDQKAKGKLTEQLNVIGPNFKLGDAVVVTKVDEFEAVALACYGPRDAGYNELESLDESRENRRWGVGAGHRALVPYGFSPAAIQYDVADHPQAVGEALTLASWKFQEFKHHQSPVGYGKGSSDDVIFESLEAGVKRGVAQNWARYLSDMPANKMTPVDLAQEAINVLCPLGVQVTARDRDWIEANHMQAFLTVARGSCETPIFLEVEYRGDPGGSPIILMAAKGVTFDCGGLCLKRPADMVENRGSMAGAAAALGAVRGLAELKEKVNVVLVIPLCENMISGQCMKVGDVVPALNGTNILIEDTDMEGRLMLADALVYAQAKYHPSVVVDIATFTPGIKLATGGGCYGCFTNNDRLWAIARYAGVMSGDRPWRFPLWDYYRKQIVDDPSVDLRNHGSGKATPCIGAAFLKNFICHDWLHFDITGVGKLAHDPPPYLQAHRMSGRPTRALIETLIDLGRARGERRAGDDREDTAQGCKDKKH